MDKIATFKLGNPYNIPIQDRDIELSTGETVRVWFPVSWSTTASRIVAEKYFHRISDTEREYDLIAVAKRMTTQPIKHLFDNLKGLDVLDNSFKQFIELFGYDNKEILQYDLMYMIAAQLYSPNSPTWFNIGIDGKRQQSAACFIIKIEDSLVDGDESIMAGLAKEAAIFKRGSGSGCNVSNMRAEQELLGAKQEILGSGYGIASGPVSFMKVLDVSAGVVKSAGEARRAACMRICDIWHLDVEDFIKCKVKYEKIGRQIVEAGIMSSSEMQDFLPFQNANHCVRLTRDFMEASQKDLAWELHGILKNPDGSYRSTSIIRAKTLFDEIVDAIWETGEPTIQFHDTINKMNPCSHLGEITGSNPCSEYMWFA
ncbi:MAG: hypothetical protein ACTSRU_21705, partial [Candidatus Hodarchaeales archaeon]